MIGNMGRMLRIAQGERRAGWAMIGGERAADASWSILGAAAAIASARGFSYYASPRARKM